MITSTASGRWAVFLRLGELQMVVGSIHLPVRTSGVEMSERALGELSTPLARLSGRNDTPIIIWVINNEFNLEVSDGVVIGPHVTPRHVPDARASRVAR